MCCHTSTPLRLEGIYQYVSCFTIADFPAYDNDYPSQPVEATACPCRVRAECLPMLIWHAPGKGKPLPLRVYVAISVCGCGSFFALMDSRPDHAGRRCLPRKK